MLSRTYYRFVVFCLTALVACACSSDADEIGQQVGDAMASVDEAGGSSGSLAAVESHRKTFERLSPRDIRDGWIERAFAPTAYATTCALANTFGSCSSNTRVRTFSDCTIGGATFSGTVTLSWSGSSASCTLGAANDHIDREPAFTVTGRRGATLTVSKTSSHGQRLTWESGSGSSKVFSFSNDGIRRVFTNASGTTTFDFTTATTADITVTGTSRASRVMDGGTLRVTNNLTSVTCDFSPSNVTWAATCNCPTSGSWSGTCSDGKTTSLAINGCGTAALTVGSTSTSVTFDRCYGI